MAQEIPPDSMTLRQRTGSDAALPDAGLAIWHVDELGNNSNEQMTSDSHYECSLEQADGRFDFERGAHGGDDKDLHHSQGNDAFGDTTNPSSKWWDGTPSGLAIHGIGPSGATIDFKVG